MDTPVPAGTRSIPETGLPEIDLWRLTFPFPESGFKDRPPRPCAWDTPCAVGGASPCRHLPTPRSMICLVPSSSYSTSARRVNVFRLHRRGTRLDRRVIGRRVECRQQASKRFLLLRGGLGLHRSRRRYACTCLDVLDGWMAGRLAGELAATLHSLGFSRCYQGVSEWSGDVTCAVRIDRLGSRVWVWVSVPREKKTRRRDAHDGSGNGSGAGLRGGGTRWWICTVLCLEVCLKTKKR
jgi:hypothetical protein